MRSRCDSGRCRSAPGCAIGVTAAVKESQLLLRVQDHGAGYPETVLRRLAAGEAASEDNALHILGLHLVQQIVRAHGGSVRFDNAGGARAEICLPIPGHAEGGTRSGIGSAGLP